MKFFKRLLRVSGGVFGGLLGGPVGAAIGSGVTTAATGGKFKDIALGSMTSGMGAYGGGKLLGSTLGGGVGGYSGTAVAQSLGGGLGALHASKNVEKPIQLPTNYTDPFPTPEEIQKKADEYVNAVFEKYLDKSIDAPKSTPYKGISEYQKLMYRKSNPKYGKQWKSLIKENAMRRYNGAAVN